MTRHETLDTDVCILGAGPHGLAVAVHLVQARPSIRLLVVDPSGRWLSTWHDQMARAEIPTLRSPIVHSPSPNPSALAQHLATHRLPSSGLPYDLPTIEAFASFCDHLIADSDLGPPLAVRPQRITREQNRVRIETDTGAITADHLVLATNPHRRQIPEWVRPNLDLDQGRCVHANDVDLREMPNLTDENVVVVGGGLSAAHLAHGAAKRGANVNLLARRAVETRNFDTDPGWLGPKYLRAFDAEDDPAQRLYLAQTARGGGTIPFWMRERLDTLAADDALTLFEATSV